MPRYAALLRGVSPMNCKMPALKASFEAAGFDDVKTVLASGNVVFSARKTSEQALARKAESTMEAHLGRTFKTIIRSVLALEEILAADPYAKEHLAPDAKRVVTFLVTPPKAKLALPLEVDGARIVAIRGTEVFTAYVPSPKGPAFMTLLEKTFGKDITTRTWDTVRKLTR